MADILDFLIYPAPLRPNIIPSTHLIRFLAQERYSTVKFYPILPSAICPSLFRSEGILRRNQLSQRLVTLPTGTHLTNNDVNITCQMDCSFWECCRKYSKDVGRSFSSDPATPLTKTSEQHPPNVSDLFRCWLSGLSYRGTQLVRFNFLAIHVVLDAIENSAAKVGLVSKIVTISISCRWNTDINIDESCILPQRRTWDEKFDAVVGCTPTSLQRAIK